jgi:RNA recognition motif-containing protein
MYLQVLFVKNLSNRIKEADLVSVFGHMDNRGQQRIIYRLMTGRMKGQAFITFPSMQQIY